MILDKIQGENDIQNLAPEELDPLAQEIRNFLVEKISMTGGHLASNLGVVELTMALHLAFHLPEDKLIWDVGHQSYTHKLLTGRKSGFENLRAYGGMSGFPKRKESSCDAFDTGHSSTSISAGLGYVAARDIRGEDHFVAAVIGDGSMTGGMAYEALNNAARLKSNFIIVLNDNNMSISENVGGMSNYLNGLRTAEAYMDLKRGVEDTLKKIPGQGERIVYRIRKTKSGIKQLIVPGMLFENMGITYLGPVDGHDIKALYKTFREAKRVDHAVLVHVITKKGKGYEPAEKNPSGFHGTGPFEIATGKPKKAAKTDSYTDVFSKVICDIGRNDEKVAVITAAMADMIRFAVDFPGPVAVRYPRGEAYEGMQEFRAPVVYGKSEVLYEEGQIALLFVGHMSSLAEEVWTELKKEGFGCTLVNARFVKPLDGELLEQLSEGHRLLVTIEENVLTGGFGSQVRDFISRTGLPVQVCAVGLPDAYVEHGNAEVLRRETGLEKGAVVKRIREEYERIQKNGR